MAIDDLTRIVPPPDVPESAGQLDRWKEVESDIGLKLPADYRDFGLRYGSGAFHDGKRLTIWVHNPFSQLKEIRFETERLQMCKDTEGNENVSFAVYPTVPGLLAWGQDNNGGTLCWFTEGTPGEWPIVLRSPEGEYETVEMPMTTFLAALFSGELSTHAYPEPFFRGPEPVQFVPE